MNNLKLILPAIFLLLTACGSGGGASNALYAIGDAGPAGGIVFYITDGGLHGLEAAPVDQDNGTGAAWCTALTDILGTGTDIGTGATNMAAILASCAEAGSAPTLADAYTLNGYTDWFLPSRDELNALFLQKGVVGGFASYFYWSSSQGGGGGDAWLQDFGVGDQLIFSKGNALRVRAVRAF